MIVTQLDVSRYPHCISPVPCDTPTRTPGVHLTTVIRDMATTAGIGKDSSFTDADLDYYAAAGHLWERVWDNAHREAVDDGTIVNPGEFELDGIIGTPDRIDWSRPAVIELKCRWKSANKFDSLEREFWAELTQTAAYCWMTQVMEADLVVFFVAGKWQPPVPEVRGVNLKFTEMELEETWATITGHARWRGWL